MSIEMTRAVVDGECVMWFGLGWIARDRVSQKRRGRFCLSNCQGRGKRRWRLNLNIYMEWNGFAPRPPSSRSRHELN